MPVLESKADEQQIIDSLHAFIAREIMPIQKSVQDHFDNPRLYYLEDGREAPAIVDARKRARMAASEAGFYTMFCPAEFGGADLGYRLWFLCWESIFQRYGSPTTQLPYYILSHFTGGPHEVWSHASDELKARVLPGLTSGQLQGAFGLSEPDAGSDNWMMRTTAVRDGDHWIINGAKQWTSWSPTADFIMVYAVTDKAMFAERKGGITCFFVPTDTPGYRLESVIRFFGHLGSPEGILSFTDVRVPDTFRVGDLNRGFDLAMLGVLHGRLANAGRTLGLARWALDKTIDYVKVRRTFGKLLADHQTIQNYISESLIDLYAGRAMALDCCAKLDTGRHLRAEVSMLKVFCTRHAFEIIDRCMQIHGAMGITNEVKLYDAWQNTRSTHFTEGSNEIQLRSIFKELMRGRVDLNFD